MGSYEAAVKYIEWLSKYGVHGVTIQSLNKRPKINIYGNDYKTKDGTCIRDYIHVSDLADIHIKTLKRINKLNKSIVLNCGYGKGISVLRIVNEFKKFSKEHLLCKANQVKDGVKNFSFKDDIKIDGKSVNELIKKK